MKSLEGIGFYDELVEAMEESEDFKLRVENLLKGYQAYKEVYSKKED